MRTLVRALALALGAGAVSVAGVSARAFDPREQATLAGLEARFDNSTTAAHRRGWFNYDEWKVRGVNLGGW